MGCLTREVASCSIGSVEIYECGMVSVKSNGGEIQIPRAAFTSFSGMIEVASLNIIARGLNDNFEPVDINALRRN